MDFETDNNKTPRKTCDLYNDSKKCVPQIQKNNKTEIAKKNHELKNIANKNHEDELNDKRVNLTNLETELKHRTRITTRAVKPLFLLLRMKISMSLLKQIVLLFCLVGQACAFKEQRFAIEPQDQSAVVGSRVTLPCRVENKAGQLQWTKDDFGLGTHRHLAGYERYKMIGSDEEGDFSLDIREVTLEDDGLYQCQVSTGSQGEEAIRSRYARLIVLVPPERPRILQGSSIETVEDGDVSLECVSVGGKPAAEITWVDSDGGVLTQRVTYTVEPMADGRRFTARSVLSIRPRRQHHNQTFTCQAQNTADRTYKSATIRLKVKYAPKVRMFIKSASRGRIQEGDTLSVGCQATANPNSLSYKWYINNELIIGNFTSELVIRNVSRRHNGALVKCEVFNAVGKSAETKTVEVTYGPVFIVRPEDVEAEEGSTATFSCVVDGHPKPEILWLHYENQRIVRVGKSSNLSVSVSQQTAGQYWCRATVEGYPDVEAVATVYLKGPPKILSNRTQYGVEGDSVKLDCLTFSVPKPDFVLWTFAGHEINSFHNQEYAFLEETLQDGLTKSTLIIRDSLPRHFGTYNCTVTNLFGTDSVEVHLIPDKSFPLIVIISGGASSAILVLVIMLIIMLCHRRRRKNIPEEIVKKPDVTDIGKLAGDRFKDSDRRSDISDLKLELKQVEGNCEMDNSNISETEFHSNMHLTTNLGLPLAGPVHIPASGFDNELMKQYQRYSSDFSDPNHIQFKVQGQTNGYIPYVDYSRDYIPPVVQSNDSLSGSIPRSIDTASTVPCNSGHSQSSSLQRSAQNYSFGGPDVIPMSNNGSCMPGVDVRYAATYGNPYLRVSGPIAYIPQLNTANPGSTPAPPPYYTIKNPSLTLAPVTSITSPSSTSSRSVTSTLAVSSSSSGAQPQVPKSSPQSPGALYILPATSHGSGKTTQISTKGNGSKVSGTHV